MKNKPLIIGVILLLLVAAGGYFFMQSRSAEQTIGPNGKKMAEAGESKVMSLKDLMNLGSNQMCTFSYTDENGSTEGTSYIAGNRVRTDFTGTQVETGEYTGGMIIDSEYMYSWTSEMDQGFKMPVSTLDEDVTESSQEYADDTYEQQIDPNVETEYNCSNWKVDNNKFTPPSYITFTDFSEQLQMMQQTVPGEGETMEYSEEEGASEVQCALCDQAGDAAAACRQALGCIE